MLAKVTRDAMMKDYDSQYPGYGFAKNKGYGTADSTERRFTGKGDHADSPARLFEGASCMIHDNQEQGRCWAKRWLAQYLLGPWV